VRSFLRQLPSGAWAGLVIIGLGLWSRSITGVVIGGILAVATLIATDRAREEPPPDQEPTVDDKFKDL
jgi:hypothetical protein